MAKRTGLDELKLIGLLWSEPSVGSRSGLTTRSLVSLAVKLADSEGMGAVTIRRLAEEAGVTAMALYPHIGGRAELLALMLDYTAGLTYESVDILGDAEWRARIRLIADANWSSCHLHPWITEISSGRPVPGPGAAAKYETELNALEGLGLTDIEMDHTLTALIAFVQGTARASLAIRRSRGSGEQDDNRWWSNIEPALTAAIGDPAGFPTATRVARALGGATGKANDPEGAYRLGLTLFLEGLAQLCEPRRGE